MFYIIPIFTFCQNLFIKRQPLVGMKCANYFYFSLAHPETISLNRRTPTAAVFGVDRTCPRPDWSPGRYVPSSAFSRVTVPTRSTRRYLTDEPATSARDESNGIGLVRPKPASYVQRRICS